MESNAGVRTGPQLRAPLQDDGVHGMELRSIQTQRLPGRSDHRSGRVSRSRRESEMVQVAPAGREATLSHTQSEEDLNHEPRMTL